MLLELARLVKVFRMLHARELVSFALAKIELSLIKDKQRK